MKNKRKENTMDAKQNYAFNLVSNYLEARNASQDSFSLENRILYWDKKFPSISALELASITIVNPVAYFSISDSDIREFCLRIFPH